MKVGDLVRIKTRLPNWTCRFLQVPYGDEVEDNRLVTSDELKGKIGIIISNAVNLEHYKTDGVYHVAFGNVVIRAFNEYLEKL